MGAVNVHLVFKNQMPECWSTFQECPQNSTQAGSIAAMLGFIIGAITAGTVPSFLAQRARCGMNSSAGGDRGWPATRGTGSGRDDGCLQYTARCAVRKYRLRLHSGAWGDHWGLRDRCVVLGMVLSAALPVVTGLGTEFATMPAHSIEATTEIPEPTAAQVDTGNDRIVSRGRRLILT